MKIYLRVPYAEKDAAKALGAKWDIELKQWYVPDGVDPAPWKKWMLSTTEPSSQLPNPPQPQVALTPSWLPSYCFGTSLKRFLSIEDLSALRRRLFAQQNGCCAFCGRKDQQFFVYPDWEYYWGKDPLQRLRAVLLICSDCHQVKYYGINRINGFENEMLAHLAATRGCSRNEALALAKKRENLFFKFSAAEWDLDVTALANYGFSVDPEIVQTEKNRRARENKINVDAAVSGLQQGWH